MLYSCCLPVLFYQLLNNIGFCEYGTKWSGISERTSYQINLQHRVHVLCRWLYSSLNADFKSDGLAVVSGGKIGFWTLEPWARYTISTIK